MATRMTSLGWLARGLGIACLLFGVLPAQAAPITTLFNTGVNAAGVPLPDDTVGDPHYTLTVVPPGSTTTILVRRASGGFPIPPYLGDDPISAWIGPNNDHQLDGPVGFYTYRTTFDLTGFNPATAQITGQWSTDNPGIDILINGISTGQTNPNEFTSWTSFSINGGFVAGLNTLDFIVRNDGGPTALRVEMTGTASPAAVPEPGSLTLLGLGVASLLGFHLRRRAKGAD